MIILTAGIRHWPLHEPFVISRETMLDVGVVEVELRDQAGNVGVAEAVGVDHAGETPASVLAQIEHVRSSVEAGITRRDLASLLPSGGARNALDCALWDLEAKRSGTPAWRAAGLQDFAPRPTAYTFGLMTEEALRDAAMRRREFALLKVKTDRQRGIDPARIVHEILPHARLILDANEDWTAADLERFGPDLVQHGVVLLEQPVHPGDDMALVRAALPVPVAADEAFIDADTISNLVGKYQVLNIKLDKTGGLTEALMCVRAGRTYGFDLMVGCMVGSSLAMAPATIVAQHCAFVDLDGPLLQAADRANPIGYHNGMIGIPAPELWG